MIWKTSEKKNEKEIQNKMEGHFSKIEQTEDRIEKFHFKLQWPNINFHCRHKD
jgi:hypothetical protein